MKSELIIQELNKLIPKDVNSLEALNECVSKAYDKAVFKGVVLNYSLDSVIEILINEGTHLENLSTSIERVIGRDRFRCQINTKCVKLLNEFNKEDLSYLVKGLVEKTTEEQLTEAFGNLGKGVAVLFE